MKNKIASAIVLAVFALLAACYLTSCVVTGSFEVPTENGTARISFKEIVPLKHERGFKK